MTGEPIACQTGFSAAWEAMSATDRAALAATARQFGVSQFYAWLRAKELGLIGGEPIAGPKCEYCHGTGQPGGIMGGPEHGLCSYCGGTGFIYRADSVFRSEPIAENPMADEREAFEAWAADNWQNSAPPHAAWTGWQARAARISRPSITADASGYVSVPLAHAMVVTEIANRNEQSSSGDIMRGILGSHPAPEGAEPAVDIEKLCKPWEFGAGDPPDYESPLTGVYTAGISYAFDRLAGLLDVRNYTGSDGAGTLEGDVCGTLQNILVAAGFVDKNGDLAHPLEGAGDTETGEPTS